MAGILGDGREMSGRPLVGGGLPVAAVVLAFLAGAIHPFEVHPGSVITESLPGLIVLAVLAGLGAAIGFWGFLGFVVGDLFLSGYRGPGGTFTYVEGVDRITEQLIPLAVLYSVVFVAMVLVPVVAQWISADLWSRATAGWGRLIAEGSAFVAIAVLMSLWAQAAAFLIRPVWTFQGGSPTVAAIANLQVRWWALALAAVCGRALRLVFSRGEAPPLPIESATVRSGGLTTLPWWVRAGLKSTALAVVLGGLADNLLFGLGTWAALFGILALVERLNTSPPDVIRRVWAWPVVVRLLIPAAVTLGLGMWLRTIANSDFLTTLVPLLGSVLVGLLLFVVLVPPPGRRP